jgi:hypothetical protein
LEIRKWNSENENWILTKRRGSDILCKGTNLLGIGKRKSENIERISNSSK